jgi:predicted acylesterase/phospholipase RssA
MTRSIDEAVQRLAEERVRLRASLPSDVATQWQQFRGRIAVVLSGGGARGAYQAGALLALQDAALPTNILASTSIGSVNAACYAANSNNSVGNAEPCVQAWLDVQPTAVGIEWSRYMVVLAGLVIASAGFGNLLRYWLSSTGVHVHLLRPAATWFSLGMAGLAILFFYSQLTYLYYVVAASIRGRRWRAERRKLVLSVIGNICVWAFIVLFVSYARFDFSEDPRTAMQPETKALLAATAVILLVLWLAFRNRLSKLSHRFLRLPMRSGLFPNYDRARFLRDCIPVDGLRRSPMRVVFTAADVYTGAERYFVNTPIEQLAADPGANPRFVHEKMETAEDLIEAVIASSAYPMVYELAPINGRLFTDGGIVAMEPIRAAVRLGADVLFLLLVQPMKEETPAVRTFLDVAMHTFDILMSQNLHNDLTIMENANRICSEHAARLGVRPEEVRVDVGGRRYRYVKPFMVRPSSRLNATLLDFDGKIVAPDILRGYVDGARAVKEFLGYLSEIPDFTPKYLLRLQPEEVGRAVTRP